MEGCDRCHIVRAFLIPVLRPYEGKTEYWCGDCLGKHIKEAMGE